MSGTHMKETSLFRDAKTKSVIVDDENALSEYKKRKSIWNSKNKKIESLESRIEHLESLIKNLINNSE